MDQNKATTKPLNSFQRAELKKLKEKTKEKTIWDVVVIGGGPAGMMAAGRAAERGAKVLLLEKNGSLGKKLLITGGGRCNVTNAEFDNRKLLAKFKESNKYLFSAFSQFSVQETLDFFHLKNMDTKVEALQRVFPVSNKAQSVWNVLVDYMKEGNVTVKTKSVVTGFETDNSQKRVTAVHVKGSGLLHAKHFILATGGKSHPETGSTGEGFDWLKNIGHTIIENNAALVPVTIKDTWVKKLQGVTLPNAKLHIVTDSLSKDTNSQAIKKSKNSGRILFTHFGISGPTVLNASRDIGELLKYGDVFLSIDTLPEPDHGKLNAKLQELFRIDGNKKIKNSLSSLLPSALVPILTELSRIDQEKFGHSITREERLALIQTIKGLRMQVKGLLGAEKAIVTSGGVKLDEVNFKYMNSRLFSNLFLIGDVLNIDRPSGGYSLQLCWTTGFVAGNSVEL